MYEKRDGVVKISSPNFLVYIISLVFIFIGINFYLKNHDFKFLVFVFVGIIGFFSNSSKTLYIDSENKDLKIIKRGIFASHIFRYQIDNIVEVVLYSKKEKRDKSEEYNFLYSVYLITKNKEQISLDGFSDPKMVQINSWSSFYDYNKKIAEKVSSALKIPLTEKEKPEFKFD